MVSADLVDEPKRKASTKREKRRSLQHKICQSTPTAVKPNVRTPSTTSSNQYELNHRPAYTTATLSNSIGQSLSGFISSTCTEKVGPLGLGSNSGCVASFRPLIQEIAAGTSEERMPCVLP